MARNRYDVDEKLNKEFNMESVKRLGQYIKPYSHKMILALILRIIGKLCKYAYPCFSHENNGRLYSYGRSRNTPYYKNKSFNSCATYMFHSLYVSKQNS